jgi:hypothetical protein
MLKYKIIENLSLKTAHAFSKTFNWKLREKLQTVE